MRASIGYGIVLTRQEFQTEISQGRDFFVTLKHLKEVMDPNLIFFGRLGDATCTRIFIGQYAVCVDIEEGKQFCGKQLDDYMLLDREDLKTLRKPEPMIKDHWKEYFFHDLSDRIPWEDVRQGMWDAVNTRHWHWYKMVEQTQDASST